MSIMQELYDKVAGNPDLLKKFNQINQEAETAGESATEDKLLAFAKEAGFEVSLEEMKTFFQGLGEQTQGELSDAELDQVAGGKSTMGTINVVASVLVWSACALGSVVTEIIKEGDCARQFK